MPPKIYTRSPDYGNHKEGEPWTFIHHPIAELPEETSVTDFPTTTPGETIDVKFHLDAIPPYVELGCQRVSVLKGRKERESRKVFMGGNGIGEVNIGRSTTAVVDLERILDREKLPITYNDAWNELRPTIEPGTKETRPLHERLVQTDARLLLPLALTSQEWETIASIFESTRLVSPFDVRNFTEKVKALAENEPQGLVPMTKLYKYPNDKLLCLFDTEDPLFAIVMRPPVPWKVESAAHKDFINRFRRHPSESEDEDLGRAPGLDVFVRGLALGEKFDEVATKFEKAGFPVPVRGFYKRAR